ncbi:hypothetical protein KSP39_PZI007376 [Platanthera zijinensis]|uniref:Uncharacterized protein n=1 Tax=Platanthera zijinensis TaxID=2320716 RepID=A0AAP0G9Y1_9ASPA
MGVKEALLIHLEFRAFQSSGPLVYLVPLSLFGFGFTKKALSSSSPELKNTTGRTLPRAPSLCDLVEDRRPSLGFSSPLPALKLSAGRTPPKPRVFLLLTWPSLQYDPVASKMWPSAVNRHNNVPVSSACIPLEGDRSELVQGKKVDMKAHGSNSIHPRKDAFCGSDTQPSPTQTRLNVARKRRIHSQLTDRACLPIFSLLHEGRAVETWTCLPRRCHFITALPRRSFSFSPAPQGVNDSVESYPAATSFFSRRLSSLFFRASLCVRIGLSGVSGLFARTVKLAAKKMAVIRSVRQIKYV